MSVGTLEKGSGGRHHQLLDPPVLGSQAMVHCKVVASQLVILIEAMVHPVLTHSPLYQQDCLLLPVYLEMSPASAAKSSTPGI